jgi:hypothetical protein
VGLFPHLPVTYELVPVLVLSMLTGRVRLAV